MSLDIKMSSSVELKIESIAYGGSGIARHNGIVYFVPGTITGETILATPVKVKKRFIIARYEKIIEASPHRITPSCPYAYQPESSKLFCPGCQYQHLTYNEELKVKNEQFGDLLRRIAGVDPALRKEPIGSSISTNYRNKITLHAKKGNNKYKFGYYAEDNKSLVEISNCQLACKEINWTLKNLTDNQTKFNDKNINSLTLRYTQENSINYWFKNKQTGILNEYSNIPQSLLLEENTMYGKFLVPYDSFFQINIYQRDNLIKETLKILQGISSEFILDIFGGVGVFGICAAKNTNDKVFIADTDKEAVNIAKKNAALHNVKNIEFMSGPAFKTGDAFFRKINSNKTTLILDPPRTGLGKKFTDKVSKYYLPRNIIYISCAADTLCRDLKELCGNGYKVEHTRLIDMFPRTAHFESITLLTK